MDRDQEREELAGLLQGLVCQPLAGVCYHLQAAESHLGPGEGPVARELREARQALLEALAEGMKLVKRLDGRRPRSPGS